MTPLPSPSIPDAHVAFAKAVASGIRRFRLTYEPTFEQGLTMGRGHYLRGELRIDYSSTDGRGRPCQSLAITAEATLVHSIIKEAESFN